ncbi:Stk1 family PASTA domain-containing Ser/Thr kinase [Allofustis seminis]|uniref:Stk1 family PASTA domain-containing Ser/Thr kinase n=1 Tax=Allofustis seminis TaxID=166939 RepID=UPI000367563B|nr:Stk1 family PASTA domain-containing Ser/Thr kinase [Allofustis seminis]
MIHRRISGRYELIKKIGSGGMANVYLARDLILERDVAIKLLAFDFTDDEESLRRFRREALSTTELTHPNIVSIYDVGEGEYPYIVMEFVDGMDLNEYIKKNRPIPPEKALNIMDQILNGMSYAHSSGIIHRDLKPHNVLVDKEGHVKITDFGIAVALSQNSITQTNSLLGSVHYLSPEQARGHIATKQSDIYSLGILLYEMLAGKVPFDGESAVSIALKHFQNEIPSLRALDPSIPQALENVVLKATTKDATQRYQSIDEMRQDLATSLDFERANEPKFQARDINEDVTRVMAPLTEDQLKEAKIFNQKNKNKEATKKQKNFLKRYWWAFILLLGILGLAVMFLRRPGEIAVPNLQNMTYEEAVEELKRLDLEPGKTIEETSEKIEDGKIIRTDPKAGTTVRKSQHINLYISKYPELKNYIGQNYEEVRAELTDLNIKVKTKESPSNEYEVGKIMAQSIDPGKKVRPGKDVVQFTISSGPESKEFTLKDLKSYTKDYVEKYANENGINVTFEQTHSNDVSEGQVVSHSPEAGSAMHPGSHLTVYLSSGKKEKAVDSFSTTVNIPFKKPSDSNEVSNHIEVFIQDADHSINELAYEFYIQENTTHKINFEVKEGESARYRILRDGELIEESTVSP